MTETSPMVSKAWAKARLAELKNGFSLVLDAIPAKYSSAMIEANTPAEARAVCERIRDESLAALEEIRTAIRAEHPAA